MAAGGLHRLMISFACLSFRLNCVPILARSLDVIFELRSLAFVNDFALRARDLTSKNHPS
jgi:hypothetical protein